MQNIYDFLKQKLKEKNVRVDDIVARSGVSRTTVYRMMKGLLKPTPQIYNLFIEMLDFDDRETQEFERYVKLVDVDENQIKARQTLNKMIFKTHKTQTRREDIEFIIYGEDKQIKKYDEILKLIENASKHSSFRMDLRILNCVNDMFLEPIINLVSSMDQVECFDIEHLISFSTTDNHNNILTLKSIIPMLKYDIYSAYFAEKSSEASNMVLFDDFMLIRFSYVEEIDIIEKYIILAFEQYTLSDCYVADTVGLYEFFYKRYKHIKEGCTDIINRQPSLDWFNDFCYNFETGGKCCIINLTPCYHRIPAGIYRNVINRQNEEEARKFIANLGEKLDNAYDMKQAVETIIASLAERNNLSYKYDQIDIYTKNGLETFAKERSIGDHYIFLPKFTTEEMREILTSIRNKNNDPKDKYRFYITNASMSNDNILFYASEKNGIIIEYFGAMHDHGEALDCWIKDVSISKAFWDFAENFVPENLAMSAKEANKFIDYLIDTYCSVETYPSNRAEHITLQKNKAYARNSNTLMFK